MEHRLTKLDKELYRLLLVRDISLRYAEKHKGNIRDFFLAQTMRLENEILDKFGYKIRKQKKKTKKK